MGIPFLLVYFAVIPAVCTFTFYKFARLWLWASPIAATVLGTLMMTAYLGGSAPGGDQWLTLWGVLVPIQQLAAISFSLGVLVGMRWGGSLGLAVGGAGVVLGLMVVAVTDLSLLLYPLCLILYALVLVLSFTGKARRAWEEYRQGNTPEL